MSLRGPSQDRGLSRLDPRATCSVCGVSEIPREDVARPWPTRPLWGGLTGSPAFCPCCTASRRVTRCCWTPSGHRAWQRTATPRPRARRTEAPGGFADGGTAPVLRVLIPLVKCTSPRPWLAAARHSTACHHPRTRAHPHGYYRGRPQRHRPGVAEQEGGEQREVASRATPWGSVFPHSANDAASGKCQALRRPRGDRPLAKGERSSGKGGIPAHGLKS